MKPRLFLVLLMVALATGVTLAQNGASLPGATRKPVRVLLVLAHPDDEYEAAGTIYRISEELFGTVDQIIITDGESGYRYSNLAVLTTGSTLPTKQLAEHDCLASAERKRDGLGESWEFITSGS